MARRFLVFATLLLCATAELPAQQFALLHSFTGSASDGGGPTGSLTISGLLLYGLTNTGGEYGFGTAFDIGIDGSNFNLLHSFADDATDGAYPQGSLTQADSQLYGMTSDGGSANPSSSSPGVIFNVSPNGSQFNLLQVFDPIEDGGYPFGSLVQSGSMLYGMTEQGGTNNDGTIFSIGMDGGFSVLHAFAGGANDGSSPYGSLIAVGSTLYGMTQQGGANNYGTIFDFNASSGFNVLHSFAYPDGVQPQGSLVLDGSTLYGMTVFGGSDRLGTIFQINTDGSGFKVLHNFTGGADDGAIPNDSLTISGSEIYGMTAAGGADNDGVIFDMNLDGSGFGLLHTFTDSASDGAYPQGSLVIDDSTLYGMTEAGGASNDGVVFALAVPEPATISIVAASAALLAVRRRIYKS
jgi:uncharacterized repeat protein (TIGR03803 family)